MFKTDNLFTDGVEGKESVFGSVDDVLPENCLLGCWQGLVHGVDIFGSSNTGVFKDVLGGLNGNYLICSEGGIELT